MPYKDDMARLAGFREQIAGIRKKMREVQASVQPEPVTDYEFSMQDGPRSLSALFGDKRDLFVIHNMGASCLYCTLWADGFNGIYPHITDRAAFVVASPDPPEKQRRFAEKPGLALPDGEPSGHQLRRRYGISIAEWRLVAGRVGVSPRGRSHPARIGHRLLSGRRFLHGLAVHGAAA
jgi:predicted dithiol-disulfide oxidoreductase (DUF899 family)